MRHPSPPRPSDIEAPTPRPDLYAELLQLSRGVGALRLALADGVDRLEAMNGFLELGHPGLDSYGREGLGRSGRWLGDARALNCRLLMLPILRAAYLVGMVSTSKAELLSSHLVRAGDLDEVAQRRALHLANELSVRELRQYLRSRTSEGEDEDRPPVQLTRTVTRLDAALFEGAVKLLAALGATTRKDAVEAMLAEAMTTLLDLVPKESEVRADLLARWARPSWLDGPRSDLPMSGDTQPTPTAPVQNLEDEDLPEPPTLPPDIGQLPADLSLDDLDRALRRLSAELTRRDLRLGALALEAELVPFLTHTTLTTWRGTAPRVAQQGQPLRVPASGLAAAVAGLLRGLLAGRFRCQNPVCRSRSVTSKGSLCAFRRAAWRPQWPARSEAFLLAPPHHLPHPRRLRRPLQPHLAVRALPPRPHPRRPRPPDRRRATRPDLAHPLTCRLTHRPVSPPLTPPRPSPGTPPRPAR